MIGGNVTATIQIKDEGTKNVIGERIHVWSNAMTLKGFLDYQGGQNDILTYDAKMQETTHIFICDFTPISITTEQGETVDLTSEVARMKVNDDIYQILMMDDPMGLHKHLEIYLKYVGGGLGV